MNESQIRKSILTASAHILWSDYLQNLHAVIGRTYTTLHNMYSTGPSKSTVSSITPVLEAYAIELEGVMLYKE